MCIEYQNNGETMIGIRQWKEREREIANQIARFFFVQTLCDSSCNNEVDLICRRGGHRIAAKLIYIPIWTAVLLLQR